MVVTLKNEHNRVNGMFVDFFGVIPLIAFIIMCVAESKGWLR